MSFADATFAEPANASGGGGAVGACFEADDIAQTPDKNLRPRALEAKKLMVANDANVAAAEQALKLSEKTPSDHWWPTIESFQRKLAEAKQKRDNDRQTINDKFKGTMWKLPDEDEEKVTLRQLARNGYHTVEDLVAVYEKGGSKGSKGFAALFGGEKFGFAPQIIAKLQKVVDDYLKVRDKDIAQYVFTEGF